MDPPPTRSTLIFAGAVHESRTRQDKCDDDDIEEEQLQQEPPEVLHLESHMSTAAEMITASSYLLTAGHLGPSIETLRESIALLSRPAAVVLATDDDAIEAYLNDCERAVSVARARLLERGVNVDQQDDEDGNEEMRVASPSGPCDGPLIYTMPVRLPRPDDSERIIMEEVSAAALYNLALAHHLEAANQPRRPALRRSLNDKALALYEMCESILIQLRSDPSLFAQQQEEEEEDSPPHSELLGPRGVAWLSMAVMNNMGSILLGEGGDHRRGRDIFENLHAAVCAIRATPEEEEGEDAIHSLLKVPRAFDVNVLMASQMNGAPAA